jgi:hypothetical protein
MKTPADQERRTMQNTNPPRAKGQPPLAELLAGYVQKQTEAHTAGLATYDLSGEVVPYEAGPVQPIDARPAWEEAVAVARLTTGTSDGKTWKAPPGWPALVAAHEPAFDLAMCLGNFPQLVRNLHPLLSAKDLTALRKTSASRPVDVPALTDWAEQVAGKQQFPQTLLAIAALRLGRQYDKAQRIVDEIEGSVPAEWQTMWDNEKAALAWHRGDVAQAQKLWAAQPESVAVLFNRGMAALFTGDAKAARDNLNQVVSQLPESSAWHHLARLYLTLADSRG